MYLAVLLDLCTREIAGWAAAARQDAATVIAALRMASRTERLAENGIAHTDRAGCTRRPRTAENSLG